MRSNLELIARAILSLRRAMQEVPEDSRQILWLHRIEGLTQAEIAVRLNIDPQAVEQKLCEVIAHLHSRFLD